MWIKWLVKYGAGGRGGTQWTGKQRENELTVHLKICAGYGGKSRPRWTSVSLPKKRRERDTWLRGTGGPCGRKPPPSQGSLRRPDSETVPSATESWHPEPLGGGRPKRAKLYPFLESGFPQTPGVPTPSRDPTNPPSRTTPGGSPGIPPSFRLLPPLPAASPTAPPERRRRVLLLCLSLRGRPARWRQGLPNPAAEGCRARASQAPPGPTCEAGRGSVCSPTGGLSRALEGEARRKRGVRSADWREKAAWARGPRGRDSLRPGAAAAAAAARETSSEKTAQEITE